MSATYIEKSIDEVLEYYIKGFTTKKEILDWQYWIDLSQNKVIIKILFFETEEGAEVK